MDQYNPMLDQYFTNTRPMFGAILTSVCWLISGQYSYYLGQILPQYETNYCQYT